MLLPFCISPGVVTSLPSSTRAFLGLIWRFVCQFFLWVSFILTCPFSSYSENVSRILAFNLALKLGHAFPLSKLFAMLIKIRLLPLRSTIEVYMDHRKKSNDHGSYHTHLKISWVQFLQ